MRAGLVGSDKNQMQPGERRRCIIMTDELWKQLQAVAGRRNADLRIASGESHKWTVSDVIREAAEAVVKGKGKGKGR